jgi:hypothetical protein
MAVASLVVAGKITAGDAVIPILEALTSNAVTKAVLAATSGDRAYALEIIPGLLLVIGAAWAGLLLS